MKDKTKQAEASRRHYERNKDLIKKRAMAQNEIRLKRDSAKINAIKRKPCSDCKVEYPSYVMQFDHVRGKKVGNVSTMIQQFRPWSLILEEIAKCELVCANCHAIRTHQRRVTR